MQTFPFQNLPCPRRIDSSRFCGYQCNISARKINLFRNWKPAGPHAMGRVLLPPDGVGEDEMTTGAQEVATNPEGVPRCRGCKARPRTIRGRSSRAVHEAGDCSPRVCPSSDGMCSARSRRSMSGKSSRVTSRSVRVMTISCRVGRPEGASSHIIPNHNATARVAKAVMNVS